MLYSLGRGCLIVVIMFFLDLSGKMVTFPAGSINADVILVPDQSKNLTALTVCLRFFSDTTNSLDLISYLEPVFFFKLLAPGYEVKLLRSSLYFDGLGYIPNEWTSACTSWESLTDIVQLWVNGKPSTRKGLYQGGEISGTLITLGKSPDAYSPSYFTGMFTDVYMWDSVLPYSEIVLYMRRFPLRTKGNIINWKSLNYTTKGYVIVEDIVDGLLP